MNTKNRPYRLPLAVILAISAPVVVAAEADITKGEEKSQVCIACHGQQGISEQDNYPHLHGQRQTYLLRQLHTFRDGGDRRDPIMTPMLENMSDQDLIDLAAYYSSFGKVLGTATAANQSADAVMPSPEINKHPKGDETAGDVAAPAEEPVQAPVETASAPATAAPVAVTAGDAGAGKTKSAACAACHGMDGRGTTPLFPNLNGQKPDYLAGQLKAFRDGVRTDPTMAPMAMALSDQDIADLAAFYGGMK